jgi:F-type H+-transporting ATPase subunit a
MEESPLHPFELHNYIPISLGGLDISINKAVIKALPKCWSILFAA